jgi:hypothetical protein
LATKMGRASCYMVEIQSVFLASYMLNPAVSFLLVLIVIVASFSIGWKSCR